MVLFVADNDREPPPSPIRFRMDCSDGDLNLIAGRGGYFIDLLYISKNDGAIHRFSLSDAARKVLDGLQFDGSMIALEE